MTKINDILQWSGAVFIIAGHSLNALGPAYYPWNIVAFTAGTIAFLTWAIRVRNNPQMIVNVVSIAIGAVGLVKAIA